MADENTSLFTMHSRAWRRNRYVYPVVSRRSKGLSIGVNVNPDKACNFDCVYCSVDRSAPPAGSPAEVDLGVLREELEHLVGVALNGELFSEPPFDRTPAHLRRVNDVAFSGDGEPTSYRGFGDACRVVADVLDNCGPAGRDVKIVVITNATLLHRPAVTEALAYLDRHNGEIWAKLDAGTEGYYRAVERTSVPFARVLQNIRDAGRVQPIVIQSMFMKLHGVGPGEAEIDEYVQRLRELINGGCRISLVQVYTVARGTAEAYTTPLPDEAVDGIVGRVRQLGLPVEGFYGPG